MKKDKMQGFQEVVFSVADIASAERVYVEVAGWEVSHRGESSGTLWGMDADWHISECLLANPGDDRGYLRLVKFHDVPDQRVIRSSGQTWDTGGIFDVNVRVRDIQTKFEQLRKHGWHGITDPIEYTFAGLVVKEVLMVGHDDVVFALIERVDPPLEGWETTRELSRIFNSSQIVRDIDAEVAFYTEKLGFKQVVRDTIKLDDTVPNVLGIPYNLVEPSPDVAIVSPTGQVDGSVEFLAMPYLKGADFADRAVPPHRGILSLRFPVDDLDAYHAQLESGGVEIVQSPARHELPPYGTVRLLAIRTPNGARLEFFQQ